MSHLRIRQAIAIVLALIVPFALVAAGQQEAGAKSFRVGISKLMPHPALDAVEQGVRDFLATTDLEISYDLQNANGDIATASSIAQKFKSDRADVVVGIATPSAQALAQVFPERSGVPVVFSAVTDADEAGLVATNIAGVSDKNPVAAQIALLAEVTGAKTIGNIYASGEANGVILMQQAKAACEALGISFIASAVANTAEVKMAAQSIIDRVDAIYVATDNTVCSAIVSIDDVTKRANKPYLTADPGGAKELDFLIGWGFDYYVIGLETGRVIESVLRGSKAGEIGTVYIEDPKNFELWFNLDVAERLGYTIPQSLLQEAAHIVQGGTLISK
ncbi:MAG TPA: ABC transporter substrate-binding protein [Sphaerochaeta sp.]|nr:ABC transporter substrate-binding protein [Sphaerochaeta sp.]